MRKRKIVNKQHRQFKKWSNPFMDSIDTGKATPEQKSRGIIRKPHEFINENLALLGEIKKSLYNAQKRKASQAEIKLIKQQLYNIQDKLFLRLSEGNQYSYSIEAHLTGKYYLYYQNRPDTYTILISLDFDRIKEIYNEDYLEDILAIQKLLSLYFPGSYWDLGSSGKSLNFFLLLDISEFSNIYLCNSEVNFDLTFPKFINSILSDMAALLRFVFNTPTNYCRYNLEFDGIKGTMADYTYQKQNNKTQYKEIINSGTLAKLPCPSSDEQYDKLFSMSLYQLDTIIDLSLYLFFSSLLSKSEALYALSAEDETYAKACRAVEHLQSIGGILKGNTVFPSLCSGKDRVLDPYSDTKDCKEINIYSIDMTAPFAVEEENSENTVNNPHHKKSENNTEIYPYEDIQTENNALDRGRKALKYQMTECLLNGEIYPCVNEYRNYYRTHFGTGSEDEGDIKRLKATYDKYFETFKKEIENSIQSKISCLEKEAKSVISQEQINQIRNTESSFKKYIYYQDVAAAALWIYYSLINKKHREMKQFSDKEETAPMSGLKGYLSKMKEMDIVQNTCNDAKARALRKILEFMGWIDIVDDKYNFFTHISMRYILEKQHPFYKTYEKIVGPDKVQGWREYKAEMKDREQREIV